MKFGWTVFFVFAITFLCGFDYTNSQQPYNHVYNFYTGGGANGGAGNSYPYSNVSPPRRSFFPNPNMADSWNVNPFKKVKIPTPATRQPAQASGK